MMRAPTYMQQAEARRMMLPCGITYGSGAEIRYAYLMHGQRSFLTPQRPAMYERNVRAKRAMRGKVKG